MLLPQLFRKISQPTSITKQNFSHHEIKLSHFSCFVHRPSLRIFEYARVLDRMAEFDFLGHCWRGPWILRYRKENNDLERNTLWLFPFNLLPLFGIPGH